MKKIIALALASLSIVSVMAACGKTGPCAVCGKEGKLETVSYMGESADLCENCAALFDIGVEAIDSGLVDISDLEF